MNWNKNIFTNSLGLARSVLALSLLLTITFSSKEILFPREYLNFLNQDEIFNKINLFLLFDYTHFWIAQTLAILILSLVIIGIYPRLTGILHWWVAFSFFNSSLIVEGGDQVLAIITLILVPITLCDSRKNHWNKKIAQSQISIAIGNIFLILIQLQASLLYLQASIEKMYKVEEWKNGTAIYYWFNDPVFGAPDYILNLLNTILSNNFIITSLTWGVLILELCLAFALLFNSKYKMIFFNIGIAFHFAIIYIHGLPTFFLAMLGLLILYLLPLQNELDFKKYAFFKETVKGKYKAAFK